MVTRAGGMVEMGEGGHRVQIFNYKMIKFGDLMYSVVTVINNTVLHT